MSRRLWIVLLLIPAVAAGCAKGKPHADESRPPEVMVSRPVSGYLVEQEVFTGRTEAVAHVDLRAHVSGFLDKVYVGRQYELLEGQPAPIKEGEDVKRGQVLFVIQQKPFQDALNQAQANLKSLEAQRDNNRIYLERLGTAGTGTSKSDLEAAETNYRMSVSQVAAARSAAEIADQNLKWATITAPFDGRLGKRLVDPGNIVKADDTILASIEQIDPLHAYFDVDERTTLRIGPYLHEGKVPADAAKKFPLEVGLADEDPEQFPHPAKLMFADNRVDTNTGTLRMWGLFENPGRKVRSGTFVRVRMGIGEPMEKFFIAEAALSSDQGRKYVFVVDDENKVVYTPVEAGQRKDGRIAVNGWDDKKRSGLKEGDRVIVDGLQRVRSGQVVVATEVEMPRAKDEESR